MTMMRSRTTLLFRALGLALLACPQLPARTAGHDGGADAVVPVAGRPGWFHVGTGAARFAARHPAAGPEGLVPSYVILALEHGWDVDGSAETVTDTLVVPAGSTVRWQLVSGIHTLTNGRDASDPDAGSRFDYLLDEQHPKFDSTFTSPDTVEYFCFFHEPRMRGVLVVTSSASVPGERPPSRLSFTHPPRPNPTRGTVSFDIGMPREQKVRIEVLDLLGNRVALLHDGPLAAGEHLFRWRGLSDRGDRARAGVYVVVLRSGMVTELRPVTLLR
jgi:hypothetical protein